MRVEPLLFREFDGGSLPRPAPAKPYLPGGRAKGEAPPPPPVFSQEQLKQAEMDSYRKGFLEGSQEGRRQQLDENAQTDRQILETLAGVAVQVQPLFEDYRKMAVELRAQVPAIAMSIAKKAAGELLAKQAEASIAEAAERCIAVMIDEPKLTLTVHETLAEPLTNRLAALKARFPAAGEITVQPAPDLPAGDFRLEWRQGAFERNMEQLWQRIGQAAESMAASAAHDARESMEQLAGAVHPPADAPDVSGLAGEPQEEQAVQPAAAADADEPQPSQKE